MKHGEIILHQNTREIIGKVSVNLKFDIPKEMMQMLVNDISKSVEH